MKKVLELVESDAKNSENCFPKVDQVVDSLAAELDWRSADEDEHDYEGAFAELDDKLAESDRATAVLLEFPRKELNYRLMPAAAFYQPGTANADQSFTDVFGLLDEISSVRHRGRPGEDHRVIAALLDNASRLCTDLDLPSARVRVEFARETLATNHFELGRELDELARHIRYDLRLCSAPASTRAASPQ